MYFDSADKASVTELIDGILGDYNRTFEAVEGNTNTECGVSGVAIVLEEKPAIRFLLPDGADVSAYTFKVGNASVAYTTGTMDVDGKIYTYAEVSLYAYQLIREITYTNGTDSGSYHVNSYYTFVTTDSEHKDNVSLITLVEKLYNYAKAAEAYRASVAN